MENRRPHLHLAISLLGTVVLLALGAVMLGCGSSDSGAETAEQNRQAEEKRQAEETSQVKQELKDGNYVPCGEQVFVNKKVFCTFARNMHQAYYVEVVSGSGKAVGYHPPAKKDFRVFCSGTVPHKCTGFKDDGQGIEPMKGAVIFFSP